MLPVGINNQICDKKAASQRRWELNFWTLVLLARNENSSADETACLCSWKETELVIRDRGKEGLKESRWVTRYMHPTFDRFGSTVYNRRESSVLKCGGPETDNQNKQQGKENLQIV